MKQDKVLALLMVLPIAVLMAGLLIIMSGCSGQRSDGEHVSPESEQSQSTVGSEKDTLQMGTSKTEEQSYEEFFSENRVHSISIEMDAENWRLMRENPWDKECYAADVVIDDTTIENVGFRTRGNSSLRAANRHRSDRFPYRIKFDKYVKDQTFMGLDELVLNNGNDDPSFLREYLGYEVFRQIGMEVPYVFFCNVYINGELQGLYVGVEAVDNSYLDRVYGDHHGNLYKAEEDATLETGMNLDLLEQKKGNDESKNDLQQLIDILERTETGEKGSLEDILDVDSVLQYFAANAVIHNWDDYAGQFAHNYYLYMAEGRFHMIPWDMNEGFLQTQAYYRESDGARQNIATPVTGNARLENRPLVEKLLSVPAYYQKYLEYCGILKEWLEEVSENQLSHLMTLLQDSVRQDPAKFYSMDNFVDQFDKDNSNGLAGFLKERAEYLDTALNHLAGTSFRDK